MLNKALDLRGIKIASQWFSSFLCSTPYEENEKAFIEQLDFLEAVGASRINVCELTRCLFAEECSMFGDNKPIATDEEWDKLCDGLNKLGKIAADRGFKLCFHHHMATVVQTFEETKRLMDNTDPRYVYLCFDTGHFTFSKEDAVKAAKEFGPRIGHVHLKDIRPDMMEKAYAEGFKFRKAVLEGCFTIPGDGCVDYPGVFKALHDAHYEGWFIVEAEPAVHVLCVQVESVTGGAVSKNAMGRALSIGMAVSVALAMARILFGIPLYAVILPGYVLAMGLSFAVPPMFTGIAFDSGGVASGPMTAAFLLPFAMGACEALGGSILLDAFGVVALVAMTPLITIQLMGLSYRRKLRRHAAVLEEGTDEILEYDVSMYQTQEVKELG